MEKISIKIDVTLKNELKAMKFGSMNQTVRHLLESYKNTNSFRVKERDLGDAIMEIKELIERLVKLNNLRIY